MEKSEILARRLERERKARKTAESILDVRSRELYDANCVLKQAQDDLEQRVSERTQQLAIATELLKEAAQQSEAANQAKSDFLARMSHEIRTPMNCIIGLTDVLLTTPVNELQRDYLSTVQSSAAALLDIINDILDFSRIEAGKLTINAAEFSLRSEIDRMVRPLAVRAHQSNLELIIDIAADVPRVVLGDSVRINQILVNLIGNAIKFTRSGTVSLKVDMQYRLEDSAVIRFTIQDTGIGIAPEQLQSVFNAFDQGKSETNREFGGSGLGLAICSQLIELMHGEITASSKVGEGTKFVVTVELPVTEFYFQPDSAALKAVRGIELILVSPSSLLREQIADMTAAWRCQCHCVDSILAARLLLTEKHRTQDEVRILLLDTAASLEERSVLLLDLSRNHPTCHVILMASVIAAEKGDQAANCVESFIKEAGKQRVRVSEVLKPVSAEQLLQKCYQQLIGLRQLSSKDSTELMFSPGLRILLVDDMPVNRKVVKAMLDHYSVVITEAENGQKAIDLVCSQSFDLVLMDMRMPVMDGLEATYRIRQLPNATQANLPIIAVTANALEIEKDKCLTVGMNDFLTKPFTTLQLSEMVQKYVKPTGADVSVETPGTCSSLIQPGNSPATNHPAGSISRTNQMPPHKLPEPTGLRQRSAPREALFDHSFACRQVGGNLALLAELCEIFEDTFRETDTELTEAISEGQRDAISLHAHSAKGALRSLGGAGVAEIAARIEDESKAATLSEIQDLHHELRKQVTRFQAELLEFVNNPKTTEN